MKRILSLGRAAIMTVFALAGCGADNGTDSNNGGTGTGTDAISVLTREEGSGTRGAFIELLGIEEKDADGKKVDKTIDTAETTNFRAIRRLSVTFRSARLIKARLRR